MKKIVAVMATVLASVAAQAADPQLRIGATNDSNIYVIPASFVRYDDKSMSAMFAEQNKKTLRTQRGYFAIYEDDCARAYGTMYFKEHLNSEWRPNNQFVLKGTSVGDQYATVLCELLEMSK